MSSSRTRARALVSIRGALGKQDLGTTEAESLSVVEFLPQHTAFRAPTTDT